MIRKSPPPGQGTSTALSKRTRFDDGDDQPELTVAIGSTGSGKQDKGALIRTVKRTSNLEAPIISLSGAHSSEILTSRFSPDGNTIAACGADRAISLWDTYKHTNTALLSAVHKAAILDLQFSLVTPHLYTASADGVLAITDLTTGQRERKYAAHYGCINSIDRVRSGGGRELVASAGDDGVVRVWDADLEGKQAVLELGEERGGIPSTAVCWSADGAQVFVGGIDNEIHVYDIRKKALLYSLQGHTDTIASLALSPSGHNLVSSSFDSTLVIHDVKPFSVTPTRIHRILQGAPAGFESTLSRAAWSLDDGGRRVAVGGGDRTVTLWDVESGEIQYKLPGHRGTVTSCAFHPKEPVILTSSKDGTMLLGEIDPSM